MPRLLHHISVRYLSRKGQWTKNAKYEYCCCVGHICLHIITGS